MTVRLRVNKEGINFQSIIVQKYLAEVQESVLVIGYCFIDFVTAVSWVVHKFLIR